MQKIFALCHSTFRELLRSYLLITALFFLVCMLLLATFFGTVSIGDSIKVIKDFGLFSISIGAAAIIILSGTGLLNKELQKKTIYNILSKPITRGSVIISKFLAIAFFTLVFILAGSGILILYVGLFTKTLELSLINAMFHLMFEGIVLSAIAMFFSAMVVTPVLAGFFTTALFIAGRNADVIQVLAARPDISEGVKIVLTPLYWILPHLHQLSIINRVAYDQVPPASYSMWCLGYTLAYTIVMLSLSFIIFNKREFN